MMLPFLSTIAVAAEHASTAHGTEQASHGLSQYAPTLFYLFGKIPVTNAMLVAWIVTILIVLMARAATGKIQLVPRGMQNFLEFLIEGLYDMLEAILGKHLVRKTFWFFASAFLFILFSNWFGLLPLIGNITVIPAGETQPVGLFRAANSDLNMPLALATLYGLLWLYWSITEIGVVGSLKHIFGAPKGNDGIMKIIIPFIFFVVGLIEIVSILFRQVSLPLRLYGNVYAGETLLETMTHLAVSFGGVAQIFSFFLPLPFYFLELLVGLVQALVFMLLTSVFTTLMCQHEEEHGHSHTEEAH
jgi:F-type H+-transporting ATPase subunit a